MEFLCACIAGKLNHVHTVEQRLRNRAQTVCRCDEKHLAQIKRQVEIMVTETGILFRVQRFQQSGSGVAPEVACHLIHLIQQNQRIRAFCHHNSIDNFTGHCADVRPAMAADFGLIAHTAQRHAHILSSKTCRNRACNAGFANARRAHQTNNLALNIRHKGAHGQQLQNALLHLFQAVVSAL